MERMQVDASQHPVNHFPKGALSQGGTPERLVYTGKNEIHVM